MAFPRESHSREIPSENKSVYENAVTGIHCSCMVLLIGSCERLVLFLSQHGSLGKMLVSMSKKHDTLKIIRHGGRSTREYFESFRTLPTLKTVDFLFLIVCLMENITGSPVSQ